MDTQMDGGKDRLIPVYPRKHSFCRDIVTQNIFSSLFSSWACPNCGNSQMIRKTRWVFNCLPINKILAFSKLKVYADDKLNVTIIIEICFSKGRKHFEDSRKC